MFRSSNSSSNNSNSNSNEPKKYVKNCYGRMVLNPEYKSWKNSMITSVEEAAWTKYSDFIPSSSAPAPAVSTSPPLREPSDNSVEGRLNELERFRSLGLLSPEEYNHNRSVILGIPVVDNAPAIPSAAATPVVVDSTASVDKRLDELDRIKHLLPPKEYSYNRSLLLMSMDTSVDAPPTAALASPIPTAAAIPAYNNMAHSCYDTYHNRP